MGPYDNEGVSELEKMERGEGGREEEAVAGDELWSDGEMRVEEGFKGTPLGVGIEIGMRMGVGEGFCDGEGLLTLEEVGGEGLAREGAKEGIDSGAGVGSREEEGA